MEPVIHRFDGGTRPDPRQAVQPPGGDRAAAAAPPDDRAGTTARIPVVQGTLLAIASSGASVSVALLRGGPRGIESSSVAEPAGGGQSRRLLATIGELLAPAGLGAIDAVSFDAGPGAFTGLRIGCSVAQGIGFARNLPLVPVGSLEAAAWRSARTSGAERALVLVANDARMRELYVAVCAVRAPSGVGAGPDAVLLVGPQLAAPDAAPRGLSRQRIEQAWPEYAGWPWLLGGDAWHALACGAGWQALAAGGQGSQQPGPRDALAGDAQAVAELGWTLWRAGRAVDPAEAQPRYVRDKVALDVDEQRRLRAARAAPPVGGTR